MDDFEFMGGGDGSSTNAQSTAPQQFNTGAPLGMDQNNFGDPFGAGDQIGFQQNGIQMNNMNDLGSGSGSHSQSNQNWGFVPAQNNFASGNFQQQIDDDLDDEERQRVQDAELAEESRRRALHDKMMEEDNLKKQRKINGKQELDKWNAQRQKEIEQQRKTNEELQKEYYESVERARSGNNPWERVVSNCEMNSSQYVGGADVSRMRQAMLQRKADITKAGGMKKSNM